MVVHKSRASSINVRFWNGRIILCLHFFHWFSASLVISTLHVYFLVKQEFSNSAWKCNWLCVPFLSHPCLSTSFSFSFTWFTSARATSYFSPFKCHYYSEWMHTKVLQEGRVCICTPASLKAEEVLDWLSRRQVYILCGSLELGLMSIWRMRQSLCSNPPGQAVFCTSVNPRQSGCCWCLVLVLQDS